MEQEALQVTVRELREALVNLCAAVETREIARIKQAYHAGRTALENTKEKTEVPL